MEVAAGTSGLLEEVTLFLKGEGQAGSTLAKRRSGVGILLAEAAARHVDVEDTTSFSAFLEVWLKGASQHHTQAGRAVQRYLAAKGMGERYFEERDLLRAFAAWVEKHPVYSRSKSTHLCNVRNIFGVIRERRLPWLKDAATARKLASDGVWRGLFSKAQREALGRLAAFMGEQQEEEEEEASRTLASSSAMWGGGRGAVADDGPTAMMEVDPPSCLPRESAARSARGCSAEQQASLAGGGDHYLQPVWNRRWLDQPGPPVPVAVGSAVPGMAKRVERRSLAFRVEPYVLEAGPGPLLVNGTMDDAFRMAALGALACLRAHWSAIEQRYLADKSAEEKAACRTRAFDRELRLWVYKGDISSGGTSAGVVTALSLLWAFTGLRFRTDTAITGSLGVTGRVGAVGSVQEKARVAVAAGLTRLLVPAGGEEVKPKDARVKGLEVIRVSTLWEAIEQCREPAAAAAAAAAPPVMPLPRPAPELCAHVLAFTDGGHILEVGLGLVAPAFKYGITAGPGTTPHMGKSMDAVRNWVGDNMKALTDLLGPLRPGLEWPAMTYQGKPFEVVVASADDFYKDVTSLGPALLLCLLGLFFSRPGGAACEDGSVAVAAGWLVNQTTMHSMAVDGDTACRGLEAAMPSLRERGVKTVLVLQPPVYCEQLTEQQVGPGEEGLQVRLHPTQDIMRFVRMAYNLGWREQE